ncbi:MAG: hypothetical protein ACYDD0_08100 [Candidatus Dormibacteria bacterium]
MSGNWVVYLEYQQYGETWSDVFWYLWAANFVTRQVLVLAHAQSPTARSRRSTQLRVIWSCGIR